VLAAGITPSGDPFSLFALAIPMALLYGISILIGLGLQRRSARREARRAAGGDGATAVGAETAGAGELRESGDDREVLSAPATEAPAAPPRPDDEDHS
jgi:sec-independent protein translocase protein TatC